MWHVWRLLISLLFMSSLSSSALHDVVWTAQQWAQIQTLSISNLPEKPSDPSNRVAQNPVAVQLGKALFFDKRLSRDGTVSCASCHQPNKAFTDGLALAQGLGTGKRNAPSLSGVAYNKWFFWDGRKDSLWSQAVAPLEDDNEHGLTRTDLLKVVFSDPAYREQYQHLFKQVPLAADFLPSAKPSGTAEQIRAWNQLNDKTRQQIDQQFANLGKALAAYVASLPVPTNRVDHYIAATKTGTANTYLSSRELKGLRLFINPKVQCINCHTGALYSNQSFHNMGTSTPNKDSGRSAVLNELRLDRFNCLGEFSDAQPADCRELSFLQRNRYQVYGAYKTPSLRNVAQTAPYFHDGRFNSLEAVIDYYVEASHKTNAGIHLTPIMLNSEEKQQLVAFLKALNATTAEKL